MRNVQKGKKSTQQMSTFLSTHDTLQTYKWTNTEINVKLQKFKMCRTVTIQNQNA